MSKRLFAIKLLKKIRLARPVKKLIAFPARILGPKKVLLKDGTLSLPTNIIFEPTTKCNLDCQMCYQREERRMGKRDLSLKEIQKMSGNLGGAKRVSLIGAEIFARPDIFQMIEEFSKRDIKVFLTTNGTLLNESNINELIRLKKSIRGIGFSLDGLKELHNKIRGKNWAFDRTIKAINLVKKDFNVSINSVAMKDNIDELYDLIKYLRDLGIVNFGLAVEMFATPKEIVLSKKLLDSQNLPLALEVQKNAKYKFSLEKLKKTIDKIRTIKGINLVIHPKAFSNFPEEFYNGTLGEKEILICKNIFKGRIDSRGNVIFCPFIKKSFGNLLEKPMEEIWNNEELKSFRRKLLKNNLLPICKRCCRLGANKK